MSGGRRVPIAVLVSGGGTNLQALLDAEGSGTLHSGTVTLVISDRPGVFALERAAKAGVETLTLDRKALGREAFEQALARTLQERGIGLVVLAGFLSILSASFTDRFAGRIINVHPSLIPAFCGKGFYGLKVHEAALVRGVRAGGRRRSPASDGARRRSISRVKMRRSVAIAVA